MAVVVDSEQKRLPVTPDTGVGKTSAQCMSMRSLSGMKKSISKKDSLKSLRRACSRPSLLGGGRKSAPASPQKPNGAKSNAALATKPSKPSIDMSTISGVFEPFNPLEAWDIYERESLKSKTEDRMESLAQEVLLSPALYSPVKSQPRNDRVPDLVESQSLKSNSPPKVPAKPQSGFGEVKARQPSTEQLPMSLRAAQPSARQSMMPPPLVPIPHMEPVDSEGNDGDKRSKAAFSSRHTLAVNEEIIFGSRPPSKWLDVAGQAFGQQPFLNDTESTYSLVTEEEEHSQNKLPVTEPRQVEVEDIDPSVHVTDYDESIAQPYMEGELDEDESKDSNTQSGDSHGDASCSFLCMSDPISQQSSESSFESTTSLSSVPVKYLPLPSQLQEHGTLGSEMNYDIATLSTREASFHSTMSGFGDPEAVKGNSRDENKGDRAKEAPLRNPFARAEVESVITVPLELSEDLSPVDERPMFPSPPHAEYEKRSVRPKLSKLRLQAEQPQTERREASPKSMTSRGSFTQPLSAAPRTARDAIASFVEWISSVEMDVDASLPLVARSPNWGERAAYELA